MRFFEGILFILTLVSTILYCRGGFKLVKAANYTNITVVIVLVLHGIIEKTRWQLYPLYILILINCLTAVLIIKRYDSSKVRKSKKAGRRLFKGIMCILLVLSAAAAYSFPVYKMSEPKGEHKIGTISLDIIDRSRKAIYSKKTEDNRKIKIQLWYPSDNIEGYSRVPWLEDGAITSKGVTRMMGLPDFLLSHTALIKSNSFKGAPASNKEAQYPVVVISHGWTGFRNLHNDIAELLASNGYIVASIDHTYGAAVTVFEDGEAVYLNREALPSREKVSNFLDYANTLVNTYAGDIKLTLDTIESLNDGELDKTLSGKIDLSKIGLLGHSTGGGAGVTTALRDDRIKAIMGFDSWVEPVKDEDISLGLKIPALFLRSEQWEEGPNNIHLYNLVEGDKSYKELYQINGIIHQDFTMVYMYSPLSKYLGMTGKLDGWKGTALQQDLVQTFFNKYLANKPDAPEVEEVAEKYKEIEKIK